MSRNWNVWIRTEMRLAFDFLLHDFGFADAGDTTVWYDLGVRFQRGQFGIEVVLEAETKHQLAVWMRYLEQGVFEAEQWSREDIELSRFCELEGLPYPKPHEPLEGDAIERILPPALSQRADCLRRVLPLLPRARL